MKLGGWLSGQTNYPWSYYTWLGDGHTIPCDGWANPRFEFAALHVATDPRLVPQLPSILGDPVNLLWVVPITEQERESALNESTSAMLARLPADRWKEGCQ